MENQDIDLLNGVQLVGLVPQVRPQTDPKYATQPVLELLQHGVETTVLGLPRMGVK